MTCTCFDPAELLGSGDRAQARRIYEDAKSRCEEHGNRCVANHLDGSQPVATHVAYTADDETDIYEVCEQCAKGLLANRWLIQPRLLDAAPEAGTQGALV